jgi:transposase-like protein
MARRIEQKLAASEGPRDLLAAIEFFKDPEFCHKLIAGMRWPGGAPTCTRCGFNRTNYCSTRRVWTCTACGKQFTVKLGTIFEGSRIGLNKWLPVLWLIAQGGRTVSLRKLADLLGTTHTTMWFAFHRIRLAMQTDTFNRKPAPAKGAGGTDEYAA